MNYSPNDLQSYLWKNPRQNMGKSTSKYGKIHVKIWENPRQNIWKIFTYPIFYYKF